MKNAPVVLLAAVIFFLIFIVSHEVFGDYPVYEYDYKRYNYRKKPKSEKRMKSLRQTCENGGQCSGLSGIELVRCIRRCMSSDCYKELYDHDELEEGEIDVRFNSFKGCIVSKDQVQ